MSFEDIIQFKIYHRLILAISAFKLSIAQKPEQENEFYVINFLGAKIYEAPSFEAKVLKTLSVGKFILIEKQISTEDRFIIKERFSFEVNWVKPNNIDGYIFSSDLTNKKVELAKNGNGLKELNFLGELIDKK